LASFNRVPQRRHPVGGRVGLCYPFMAAFSGRDLPRLFLFRL